MLGVYSIKLTDFDKLIYEKELKSFLPKEIIDFHSHIDSPYLEQYSFSNQNSSWADRVVSEGCSAENLLDIYAKVFPSNSVTPLLFGGRLTDIMGANDYVSESAKKYGFNALYCTDYTMDADFLEAEIKKKGFIGIKSSLSNPPEYIPEKEMRIFDCLPQSHLEICNKNNLMVLLRIPRDGRLKDPVNLVQIANIEKQYPNIKLVIAHIGRAYAKEDIGNAFDIIGKGENTYFDFSANLCDDAIEECIKAVGPKKLIFGSDLPVATMRMYRIVENGVYYNVVPRGMYEMADGEPHMRTSDRRDITIMIYEQLLALKRVAHKLKLSDSDIESIMFSNAKSLIDQCKNNLLAAGDETFGLIINTIESNLSNHVTIESLAKMCNLSASNLKQIFKKHYSGGVMKYYTQRKIEKAKALMKEGYSASQISSMMGFSSQNYFTNVFKRETGVLPSEYKKGKF